MVSTLTKISGSNNEGDVGIHVSEEVVRVEDRGESEENEEEWLKGRRSRVGSEYIFPSELQVAPRVEFEERGKEEAGGSSGKSEK